MFKKIALCFIILLCQSHLFSNAIIKQGITVYSDIDKNNIGIDEQVTLRLSIAGVGYFQDPKLPEIKDFSVIKTRQFTGIDFSSSKGVPYTVFEYIFTPYKKGILSIPKISVNYKGYYYSSKFYNITVSDKIRDVVDATAPYQEFKDNIKVSKNLILIKSNISTNKVFYNQQIVYTYTVFTRVPIKKIPIIKIPEFEAFHFERLYYKKEYITHINGYKYRAFEFKFSLFPFMTEKQKIPSIKMICYKNCFPSNVIENTGIKNYFGNSAFFSIDSESFNVDVLPLALQDKPLSFSGLIGEFNITSEVDKSKIGINDSIVLTIKVKGSGNVRSIPTIKCPLMDNLREYYSDSFMNYDKKEPVMIGEKLFRFVLIPRDTGKDIIPSVGFSYFDEKQQMYLTKWTEPINIEIVNKLKNPKTIKKYNKYYLISILSIGFILLIKFIFYFRRKRNAKRKP